MPPSRKTKFHTNDFENGTKRDSDWYLYDT